MKFKIDGNLPLEFAVRLHESGFDAETVTSENLSGVEDAALFEPCQKENRVLVTLDLDFANVKSYPPKSHPEIIVLRPPTQDKDTLVSLLMRFVPVLKVQSPSQQLWIGEADRIRYRED